MSNIQVMPNTLEMNLIPLEAFDFKKYDSIWQKKKQSFCCKYVFDYRTEVADTEKYRVEMNLKEETSNLLTFGIYLRDYKHDILKNGAKTNEKTFSTLVCFTATVLLAKFVQTRF